LAFASLTFSIGVHAEENKQDSTSNTDTASSTEITTYNSTQTSECYPGNEDTQSANQTTQDSAESTDTVSGSIQQSSTEESSTTEDSSDNERMAMVNKLYSSAGLSFPLGRSDIENNSTQKTFFGGMFSRASVNTGISVENTETLSKGFVDVSSHNGSLTVADYKKMQEYGITGVVIKLTVYTTYINPYAKTQIENAKAAGLKVSAYHYSWFTTSEDACTEARFFANAAKSFGLDSNTVMVNDFEEPKVLGKGNHTVDSLAFANELAKQGYANVAHYASYSIFTSGLLNADTLGYSNIWVAAYPSEVSKENFYTDFTAWQWSSQLVFPNVSGTFDISVDYQGRFTISAGSNAIYRAYNPNSGEHFYTKNTYEYDNVISVGWQPENVAWLSPQIGASIYRLYNPNSGEHFYTLSLAENNYLSDIGWREEGVAFYSSSNKEVPVYRLYNPNAKGPGAHHYTTSAGERDVLVKLGWRSEGIAFYGTK